MQNLSLKILFYEVAACVYAKNLEGFFEKGVLPELTIESSFIRTNWLIKKVNIFDAILFLASTNGRERREFRL